MEHTRYLTGWDCEGPTVCGTTKVLVYAHYIVNYFPLKPSMHDELMRYNMSMAKKLTLFFLRVSLGWFYFYAGITKVLDPNWSAAGYLKSAHLLPSLYAWLASPGVLPVVNFVNAWGLTLLGLSLILGLFVKYSAPLGALLMLLYYVPLGIIHPDEHSLVVDQHVIYIFALLYLSLAKAGRFWGLDKFLNQGE